MNTTSVSVVLRRKSERVLELPAWLSPPYIKTDAGKQFVLPGFEKLFEKEIWFTVKVDNATA